MNKHDIQRAGTAIFEKDTVAYSERKPPEKVPAFVYWCIDKRSGLYTIASYHASVSINAVVKLTFCVYRPWIRNSRVLPAGDAITTATGYSFPSGHTTTAAPIYGGLAVSTWKKLRWISVLCFICLGLTAFSRNYLGVHTPQDVLVGLAIGTAVLFGMAALFRFLTAHPERSKNGDHTVQPLYKRRNSGQEQ